MVATHQDCRNLAQWVPFRPGVVRAVEQTRLETVLDGRFAVTERAILNPPDRIDHHRCRELATRQDVITDRQFEIDLGLQHALIDTLVASAQQDRTRQHGQPSNTGLGQAFALRAEVDHRRRLGIGRAHGIEAGAQRIDRHHHARATAEGSVIDPAIAAGRVVARIPGFDPQQAALPGPSDHTQGGALTNEFGKQGQHVDAHRIDPRWMSAWMNATIPQAGSSAGRPWPVGHDERAELA